MGQASINVVASVLGQTIPIQITRTQDGTGQWTPTIPAGKPGTLSARTNASAGTVTLEEGHGIQSGDRVDVFWAGGRRYAMAAVVTDSTVAVSLGAGEDLPAVDTAVVVCRRQIVKASFDPADIAVLLVTANRRISVVFVDAGGETLLALDLSAGECCLWWMNSGIARPITGNTVSAIWAANGDSEAEAELSVAVIYDATP